MNEIVSPSNGSFRRRLDRRAETSLVVEVRSTLSTRSSSAEGGGCQCSVNLVWNDSGCQLCVHSLAAMIGYCHFVDVARHSNDLHHIGGHLGVSRGERPSRFSTFPWLLQSMVNHLMVCLLPFISYRGRLRFREKKDWSTFPKMMYHIYIYYH